MGTVDDIVDQSNTYLKLAIKKDNAHYRMSQGLIRKRTYLGVPAVVISAIVSTAVFSTLQQQTVAAVEVITGILALLTAGTRCTADILQLPRPCTEASGRVKKLLEDCRDLDLFRLRCQNGSTDCSEALDRLNQINQELGKIEAEEPQIPPRVYDSVRGRYYPIWLKDSVGRA